MFRRNLHLVAAMVVLGLIGACTLALADEMRVLDLPIPDGAMEITYVKRRGDVRFQVTSDFKTVGDFYAQKLAEQRWTKAAKDNLQRNFWIQTFSKDKVSLEVRVDSRDGGSEVRLTPKGMMWEEDDQPTPKDLPLPAQATEIEYDDFFESIEFKSPSNVKTVVKFLTAELDKRNWNKASTEYDLATFVRMTFTQQKSTLEIDVRAEETGCEVDIRTKGMNWDGMKAEIELAKKEKEKVAEEKILLTGLPHHGGGEHGIASSGHGVEAEHRVVVLQGVVPVMIAEGPLRGPFVGLDASDERDLGLGDEGMGADRVVDP